MVSGNGHTVSHPRLSDEESLAWNTWGVEVVEFHLKRLMRRDGWLCCLLGNALARERSLMRKHVEAELAGLRREIAELRTQIKAQRAADTSNSILNG